MQPHEIVAIIVLFCGIILAGADFYAATKNQRLNANKSFKDANKIREDSFNYLLPDILEVISEASSRGSYKCMYEFPFPPKDGVIDMLIEELKSRKYYCSIPYYNKLHICWEKSSQE